MSLARYALLFDPIPFHGGSKVATTAALNLAAEKLPIHVLSTHKKSWHNLNSREVAGLTIPTRLLAQTQGLGYWCKQLYFTISILFVITRLFVTRASLPSQILVASGPGVDLSAYLVAHLFNIKLIQMIHGPISKSRASKWCLQQGHTTFYLPSSKPSIQFCLDADVLEENFVPFINGLAQWPKVQVENCQPVSVFWAASLLKWKGLDLLTAAMQKRQLNRCLHANVCYIKPEQTDAEQSQVDPSIDHIHWFENPKDLEQIRATSHIYVSTSTHEPFGLSTLEALACGLIVVIPRDGAYWDRILVEGEHCLKYEPKNADSLNQVLTMVLHRKECFWHLGMSGQKIAREYTAEKAYQPIVQSVINTQAEIS